MSLTRESLRSLMLMACVAAVVALTTLPASISLIRFAHDITVIEGHPNANDALGHAALYAALTAAVYISLRRRIGFERAFWIALGSGLLLGALTEFIQRFSPGRTMMLSDLLANWLGAMSVAMLISYTRPRRR
ncbi:MAG: VanZ family protein [Anaerolineae bacterium]